MLISSVIQLIKSLKEHTIFNVNDVWRIIEDHNLINQKNEKNETLLFTAIKLNCLELVERLLNYGYYIDDFLDVEIHDMYLGKITKFTPFWYCCYKGKLEAAELLISKGSNIHKWAPRCKMQPLSICCFKNNYKIIEVLMRYFPNLNVKDYSNNRTEMSYAIDFGSLESLKILVNHNCYVESWRREGGSEYTPITASVFSDNIEVLKLLLQNNFHKKEDLGSVIKFILSHSWHRDIRENLQCFLDYASPNNNQDVNYFLYLSVYLRDLVKSIEYFERGGSLDFYIGDKSTRNVLCETENENLLRYFRQYN